MEQERINTSSCVVGEMDVQNSKKQDSVMSRQDSLPDNQYHSTNNVQEDISQIINRILSIAREISWLSERKAPVENDNISSVSRIVTRL
ncbi:MAG: hypothetical protein H6Q72_416 [Firmicutes bacterium]|nr:hypothetical protein [Bacillota bacterium]